MPKTSEESQTTANKEPPVIPSTTGNEVTGTSRAHERFLFDCDHLIMLCSNIEKINIEEQTDTLLEIRLDELEKWWKRTQTTYENLLLSPESSNSRDFRENAKLNFNVCSETYYIARSHLVDLLRMSTGYSRPSDATRVSINPISMRQTDSENLHTTIDSSYGYIKVPPCDTDVFEGGYEEWPAFRDMFTAVYGNHPKLSRAQKLYHLRNKTKGNAGAIVKRYSLCDENFELAWNALKSRYENKRVLVDKQLNSLFNIPVATTENSKSIQKIQTAVNDCLSTLKSLDVPTNGWDPILIHLISTKLPDETLSLWEQSLKSHRELPTWVQMDEFLINRYEVVERISSIKSTKDNRNSTKSLHKSNVQTYLSQDKLNAACLLCEEDHSIRTCPEFKKFTPQQRINFVYKNKYCNNCLSSNHTKGNCKSEKTCLICKKTHHTLLHIRSTSTPNTSNNGSSRDNKPHSPQSSQYRDNQPSSSSQANPSQVQANFSSNDETILLRTALVQIQHRGDLFTTRALIDPGSQRTFVSENLRKLLQLPYRNSQFDIIGIGGRKQTSNKECEITIFSAKQNCSFPVNAIVLPKVTRRIPAVSFQVAYPEELQQLDLADPFFNQSSPIDLILGNDSERFINLEGIKRNICGDTSAYNTIFGWVLSGPMKSEQVQCFTTNVVQSDGSDLNDIMKNFWEQEEVPSLKQTSAADSFCEDFYQKTTTRQSDGRYVVRLPFKDEFPQTICLGSSRFLALGQFTRLEQTLSKNPELKEQYKSVLNEYLDLGHMEPASPTEISSGNSFSSFYLPHHAVVRPEHKTTKVRVVFNASRKTKSGFSLNDVLHTGPTLQKDLVSTILSWRKYKYVFSGDIQKMYRQILVNPADRVYQKILHQQDNSSPILDYQLNTVTFGINCAPYLAIRTLKQLAIDSEATYPLGANIIRNETYVDDILSGGFSVEEVIQKQKQLIAILKSAGFPLKKMTANDDQLLSHLPSEDLYDQDFLRFHESSSVKTLGVKWNAITDSFSYSFSDLQLETLVTKRKVLSTIARLYDPVGWITPIVIKAKLLMQQVWLEGTDWDGEISRDTLKLWKQFLNDLPHIDSLNIPRWIQYSPSDVLQIHGFCDSSKGAFCACVYVRCQTGTPVVFSNLLIAKSKVAPLHPVCLPRLELNGAVLLSWETYVANRTGQIHEMVPHASWRHVPTHDNPADLGTRGIRPQDLVHNSLWWNGPSWLTNPPATWPKRNPLNDLKEPLKIQSLQVTVEQEEILNRFSSYARALRVLSYVYRFYHRTHVNHRSNYTFSSKCLSHNEIQFIKFRLISLAQSYHYKDEYDALRNTQEIPDKSTLKTLNPFLDDKCILRVNGRLSDSPLPYNERHPIILPGNSRFCHLYLSHLHLFLAHAECNPMCRMVQTEFYISRLKRRIKAITYKCKTCLTYKQRQCTQMMTPLPPERCTITPPFHTTGIDFAGPFELKTSTIRQAIIVKGYVSVFVCFSTKAIHLEACSELTSAAARFVGRRGLPHRVVSDNGRNFIGANRTLLREFRQFLSSSSDEISQKYATQGFEWSFIPPHAPHMGGLWEAAVKIFKFHFKRIAGSHKFTFEQFTTVLARIEGVLNSRPISAMSEDPNDLTALTPGHFLKGAPLLALPDLAPTRLSLINRWLKLKALHHEFAIRWKEDLKSLHKRYKWKNSTPNLKTGDLVVVMDDLLPPSEWRLGRIENPYHGTDNKVRVADVRTLNGVITRPVVKLCYLPFNDPENSM